MRGGSGTGTSAVLSQGVISMFAYGVNFIASFFAVIGMIRIMDKGAFGMFSLAIQIVAFTAMLSDFGIGPVIMRRLAIAPARSAGILLEATYARLLLMIPAWVVTIVIGLMLEPGMPFFLMLNLMLCNMVISSKLPVIRGTLEAFYRSQSRMAVPIVTMAIDSILLLALVLLLPWYFEDPVQAMALYTASNLIGVTLLTVGTVSFARRLSTESARVSWDGIRDLLRTSSPLALFLLLNALHISIDTVYLKIFHGNEEVGIFNAALRILSPLSVFPTIIAISAAPYFARASLENSSEQRERTSRLFSLSVKTLLVGSVLLAGFGMTNSRFLTDIAFDYKFDEAVLPLIILFFLFLPMSLNMFLVELNNARGNIVTNTRAAGVLAAMSVLLGVPLVLAYASTGAALGKLVATLIGLVYLLLKSRAGIIVAMRPLAAKTAVLFLVLISIRLLLGEMHILISNGAALVGTVVCFFALRLFTTEEVAQWRSQFGGLFGRDR